MHGLELGRLSLQMLPAESGSGLLLVCIKRKQLSPALTHSQVPGILKSWRLQVVWDGTTSWLLGTHLPPACQAAGCGLLAAVAGRALAPNLPVRARKLWDLPSLRQPSSREAALCLVATAFCEGRPPAVHPPARGRRQCMMSTGLSA